MKLQFTLRSLLGTFVVVALSLAAFGPWGIAVAALALGMAWCIRHVEWGKVWKDLLVAVACLGILVAIVPALFVSRCSPQAYRFQCRYNLHQIGLALRQYQETYNTLPPVRDGDFPGRPRPSWRVLVLPGLEEAGVFRKYNQSEPWNSPSNGSPAHYIVASYVCRMDGDTPTRTNYVAVLGSDGDWLPPHQPEPNGSNPVRVVEVCDSDIHWMEPRDLPLEAVGKRVPGAPARGLSSKHMIAGGLFHYDRQLGAHALFANGDVMLIPPEVPADVLEAALRGDRGKQAVLESYAPAARPNWPRCAALGGLIGCVLLLWAAALRDRWRRR